MTLFASRASVILYNVLISLKKPLKFILPLNVCPVVPAIFLKAKVEFEFIDILSTNLCIDQSLLYERIKVSDKIGGILFVKTFGIDFSAEKIYKRVKEIDDDIFIIDDCCLQKPNFEHDIESSYADLSLFSTGYSKYIDINWGGFGFLKDRYNYIKTELPFSKNDLSCFETSIQQSIDNHSVLLYTHTNWLESKANLFANFKEYRKFIENKIPDMQHHKQFLNNIYKDNLPQAIQLGDEFSAWRFSILVDEKDKLLSKIFEQGLFASSHYAAIDFMYKKNILKNSNVDSIHRRIINFFNDFRFDQDQAYQIIDIVNKHLFKNQNFN